VVVGGLQHLLVPLGAITRVQRWRHIPLLGPVIEAVLAQRLAFLFEVALVFIKAHESLRIEKLFGGSSSISRTSESEIALEVSVSCRKDKSMSKGTDKMEANLWLCLSLTNMGRFAKPNTHWQSFCPPFLISLRQVSHSVVPILLLKHLIHR